MTTSLTVSPSFTPKSSSDSMVITELSVAGVGTFTLMRHISPPLLIPVICPSNWVLAPYFTTLKRRFRDIDFRATGY